MSAPRDLGGDDAILLALICDPGELHRRRVWEAFTSGKGRRCGRWSVLVALGARIRAAELDTFQPYRQPRPKKWRIKPETLTKYGDGEMYWFDPEDPDHLEPEPASRWRRENPQMEW